MNEHIPTYNDEVPMAGETPFSVGHFVAALKAYRSIIGLSLMAVAIAYLLVACAIYLFSPAERSTSQTFRLQFEGAASGTYPNGLRFSPTDIIATPILLRVFRENHLENFTTFDNFSKGIFVLEANQSFEKLASEYAVKLSDPKLSTVDRERLEADFELKRKSIANSDYSINFSRDNTTKAIPEMVVRRALMSILNDYSDYIVRERHVLDFNIALMAPGSVENLPGDPDDLIIRIQILRSKILRAIRFVSSVTLQPGAGLAKIADGSSADDIQTDLSDILRYRIDPLMGNIRSSGIVSDVPATIRYLESQLDHDQRELKSLQSYAEAVRTAIATLDNRVIDSEHVVAQPTKPELRESTAQRQQNETLMPQLGDNFLDRLVDLTTKAQSLQLRQRLISDYSRALTDVVPAQQSVAYDTQILTDMRTGTSGTSKQGDRSVVAAQIAGVKADTRTLIVKANQLYKIVSQMLVPTAELVAITSPPVTRTFHGASLNRLAMFGALVMLLALPLIILGCLLHNRVIEEEQEESMEGSTGVPA